MCMCIYVYQYLLTFKTMCLYLVAVYYSSYALLFDTAHSYSHKITLIKPNPVNVNYFILPNRIEKNMYCHLFRILDYK